MTSWLIYAKILPRHAVYDIYDIDEEISARISELTQHNRYPRHSDLINMYRINYVAETRQLRAE